MAATLDDIHHAAALLREGRVVAFPTETVYGLGADAFNAEAIDRVYSLKGRPRNNPMIVHVSGPDMARRVARDWSARADALARRFWPGPLSILVPRAPGLPAAVTAGGDLVAVRCPNHPVTLALLFELNRPLVGPSANISGQVSPTTAAHVRESFRPEDVQILDGGPCEAGIESTVVDVASDPPRVLRPGVIGPAQIAAILGCPVATPSPASSRQPADPLPSPGMLDRHYAPRTAAHLFDEDEWPRVLDEFGRAAVLTHRLRHLEPPHTMIDMPPDAADYAAALYAALRAADSINPPVDAILIERPPPPESDPIWAAIADRLARATTPIESPRVD